MTEKEDIVDVRVYFATQCKKNKTAILITVWTLFKMHSDLEMWAVSTYCPQISLLF